MPDPVLVGRNAAKLEKAGGDCPGLLSGRRTWTRPCPTAQRRLLRRPDKRIGESSRSSGRIAAGKHIYCEKTHRLSTAEALELHRLAEKAGVKTRRRAGQALAAGHAELRRLREMGS
jgi:hypothetical protein